MLYKVKLKNKVIANIYLLIDYPIKISKSQLLSHLTKSIKSTKNGYAGFNSKHTLKNYLSQTIFDFTHNHKIIPANYNSKTIVRTVNNIVIKCQKRLLHNKPVDIFIFPTFSNFTKTKMFGCTGYTPWKNTILIFIHPSIKIKILAKTVAHEFCHAVMLNYHKWETLLDSLIFEGLAEHFSEYITSTRTSPWAKVISKKQSGQILKTLRGKLQSKSYTLYKNLFFGNEKYTNWTGYTLGYFIVKPFLRKKPNLSWQRIIKLSPKTIFNAGLE